MAAIFESIGLSDIYGLMTENKQSWHDNWYGSQMGYVLGWKLTLQTWYFARSNSQSV